MASPVAETSLPAPSTVLHAVSDTETSAMRQHRNFLIMRFPLNGQIQKESGQSKGGGRRELRPRPRPLRPTVTGWPPGLQSKTANVLLERSHVFKNASAD